MDVAFSADQELLRKSAREFLEDQCPPSVVRDVMEGGDGAKLWKQIAELGWMELGTEGSLVDVAIIAEEMGRALLPVPWFSTVALAGEAIRIAGSDDQKARWLPKIASGEIKATLAIDGVAPDLTTADLVVVARDDGAFILEQPFEARAEPSLDMTRPLGTLDTSGVEVPKTNVLPGSIEPALDRARAILCAEMCGGSQRMLDVSVEYAKVRQQFGKPIGAFQGVSHRCADMLLSIEGARSLTYYAAWACDEEEEKAPLAVSAAKAAAGDTYRSCTAQAIQIHGGIGFTWEADLHLWYRRAFWSSSFLGDPVFHRERVASAL